MKTVLIAVLMACAGTVHATPFDIGPEGKSFVRSYTFGQLNGVQMNGQTVSFDLNFNNNVHLFAGTFHGFDISMRFQTGEGNSAFATGDGCVLDSVGAQMCGLRPLAGAWQTDAVYVGLFPLYSDMAGTLAFDVQRPLDFYGFHMDITLPGNGLFITDGALNFFALDAIRNGTRYQPFRVGPHVPDNGSTFLLFGVGIVALFIARLEAQWKPSRSR